MTYIPGTIAALFGAYYLVRAALAKSNQERNRFLLSAGIDFAIAIALIIINSSMQSR